MIHAGPFIEISANIIIISRECSKRSKRRRVVGRDREEKRTTLDSETSSAGNERGVRGCPLVRHVRVVRHRPNIISATAIARRGFEFTSVSRGALGSKTLEVGTWLLTGPVASGSRDATKIKSVSPLRGERNPLIARAAKISSPRPADIRDFRRYNISTLI